MTLPESYSAVATMGTLDRNWDGEEADPPNAFSRRTALRWLDMLYAERLSVSCILPHFEGGISISIRDGDKYCVLEVYNDAQLAAAIAKDSKSVEAFDLTDSVEQMKTIVHKVKTCYAIA